MKNLILNDPEFRAFSIPLTKAEYDKLEQDILQNGIIQPILVWNKILVDGFKRQAIADKHKLRIKVKELLFKTKEEVINFRVKQEYSKNNLSAEVRAYIIGNLYIANKRKDKNNKLIKFSAIQAANLKNKPKGMRTAKMIADEYRIGERTITLHGKFTEAINYLAQIHGEELKDRILNRDLKKLDISSVKKLAKLEIEMQKDILILLNNDIIPSYQDAFRKVQGKFLKDIASQTYNIKFNKLYNGDAATVLKSFPDASINCVIMDPPWLVSYKVNVGRFNDYDDTKSAANIQMLEDTFKELQRVLKSGSHMYVFFGISNYTLFYNLISKYFPSVSPVPLIWKKSTSAFIDKSKKYASTYESIFFVSNGERALNDYSTDVLDYESEPAATKIHPNQKPIALLSKLITQSTQENEVVLDCFAGSGATLRAARLLKRQWVGIELNKQTYKAAKKYINQKP